MKFLKRDLHRTLHIMLYWKCLTSSTKRFKTSLYLDTKGEGDENQVSKDEHKPKSFSYDIPPADYIILQPLLL